MQNEKCPSTQNFNEFSKQDFPICFRTPNIAHWSKVTKFMKLSNRMFAADCYLRHNCYLGHNPAIKNNRHQSWRTVPLRKKTILCKKIDSLDSRAFFSHLWDKWMYPSKKKGWSETSISWHHTASMYVHQLLYNCVPRARPQKRSDWQRKEEKVQVKRRKNFIDISRANVLWMY